MTKVPKAWGLDAPARSAYFCLSVFVFRKFIASGKANRVAL
jgi:hypothetical protein